MRGSGWSRLLAISLVFLPRLALGQSDWLSSQPGLAIPAPLPRIVPTPRHPIGLPRPAPPSPIGMPQLARAAGTIFSGTVTAISRKPPGHQPIETVAITFHVDQAIRGAIPGDSVTISQWMALWSTGQTYRVGERVMLFLYPPSRLGLTSLVGGELGRFLVDPAGYVLLNPQHQSAFRNDPIVGGKSRVLLSDFASAVRLAGGEPQP